MTRTFADRKALNKEEVKGGRYVNEKQVLGNPLCGNGIVFLSYFLGKNIGLQKKERQTSRRRERCQRKSENRERNARSEDIRNHLL